MGAAGAGSPKNRRIPDDLSAIHNPPKTRWDAADRPPGAHPSFKAQGSPRGHAVPDWTSADPVQQVCDRLAKSNLTPSRYISAR